MNQEEVKKQINDVLRDAIEEYLNENNPLQKGQVYSEIEKVGRIDDPILDPEIDPVELVTKGEIEVIGSVEVQVMESMGKGNFRRARLELNFREVVLCYSEKVVSIEDGSFNVLSIDRRN